MASRDITGIGHGRLVDREFLRVVLGAVDSVAGHGLRHHALQRHRRSERDWRVVEAAAVMRATAWLASVLMAAGCTLSTVQAQQKQRCLEAADAVVEASQASDDAYDAAEGMLDGIVPTRRHQQLYSAFVEADERWRRALASAVALCGAAAADNSEDDELREVYARLLETTDEIEMYDTLFDIREGCRWAKETGSLPDWWQC